MLEFIPASGIFHTAEKCRTKKQRLSPGAVHICISDILPVAGEKMSRRNFLQRREFFPAERFDIGAPSAKAASSGQIHRTGGIPLQQDPAAGAFRSGIRHGHGRKQSFVYGCLGKAYSSRAGANSTSVPRYITATRSEICLTMDRSWAINRYVSRLNGHIQSGDRFVANNAFRFHRQRPGNAGHRDLRA